MKSPTTSIQTSQKSPSTMTEEKTLARVCVRLWADDCEYLREVSRFTSNAIGFNLLVRQIVHTWVAQLKNEDNQ